MLCPRCNKTMKNTMHFEHGRQYQYNKCPNCQERTKNKRIHFEDILNSEMDKYKKNKLIKIIEEKRGDNRK